MPRPDGKYVRVTRMLKPFSYDVPVSNFGSIEEIWDADGKVLAKISDRPINLGVQDDTQPPPDPGPAGRRRPRRRESDRQARGRLARRRPGPDVPRAGAGAGRARGDGAGRGAAAQAARRRRRAAARATQAAARAAPQRKDRLYQWLPPFDDGEPEGDLREHHAHDRAIATRPTCRSCSSASAPDRTRVESAVYLAETAKRYTLARYRADDVYANPGSLVSTRGGGGGGGAAARGGGRGGGGGGSGPVLLSADGASVFFQGTVYDKNPNEVGPKTFIDKVAIKTGEKERIYESDNNGVFERVSTVLDADAQAFIVQRESPTDVPQNFLVEGGTPHAADEEPGLHARPDHARQSSGSSSSAPDGFKFRVTVDAAAGLPGGHAAAGAVLVLPARVRRPGGRTTVRIARSTRTRSRTSARARWSTSCASATPSSSPTRRSSARRGR